MGQALVISYLEKALKAEKPPKGQLSIPIEVLSIPVKNSKGEYLNMAGAVLVIHTRML